MRGIGPSSDYLDQVLNARMRAQERKRLVERFKTEGVYIVLTILLCLGIGWMLALGV